MGIGLKMKKFFSFKIIFSTLSIFLLSGCFSHNLNVKIPEDYVVPKQINYNLLSVSSSAKVDLATGDLDLVDTDLLELYKETLSKALVETGVFNNQSRHNIRIEANILKNDVPFAGFKMTCFTEISYKLIDEEDNTLYSKVISSEGTASVSDAYVADTRKYLITDRAIENNIKLFINALSSGVDVNNQVEPSEPEIVEIIKPSIKEKVPENTINQSQTSWR